jgi:hypothetical protein
VSDSHAFAKSEIKDIGRLLQDFDVVRPEDALAPPPNVPRPNFCRKVGSGFNVEEQAVKIVGNCLPAVLPKQSIAI